MIYEIRTYTLKPGTVREYEKRFADALDVRQQYSPLMGMWHTDIGTINQVIHIWPYKDMQDRYDTRKRLFGDGKWQPNNLEFLVSQEVDILDKIEAMPDFDGGKQLGEIYEFRMYTYAPGGDINKIAKAFSEKYAGRNELYPVGGIFTSTQGNLNRLYQFFPYKSYAHRDEVRSKYVGTDIWPPHADARPVNQLVRFLEPASFSPLH